MNTDMLKLARRSRGWSQTELAHRTGLQQGQISKIELGVQEPNDQIVERLAHALGVRDSFFQQQDHIFRSPTPMQRRKSRLAKKDEDIAESIANLYLIHTQTLMEDLELPVRVPEYPTSDGDYTPEQAADLLRRYWLIPRGPVESVTRTLEDNGIFVFRVDFGTDQLDGFTLIGRGQTPSIFVSSAVPSDRARFTMAHELGHRVMHRESPGRPQMEDEANQFAAEFLMPADDIREQLGSTSLERFATLKRNWRVSMQALIRRSQTLGRLSKDQARYLYIRLSKLHLRRDEGVYLPEETPTLLRELIDMFRKEHNYTEGELAKALHITPDRFNSMYDPPESRFKIVK